MWCITGLLAIGASGLGRRDVSGRRREPSPPAMTTAFIVSPPGQARASCTSSAIERQRSSAAKSSRSSGIFRRQFGCSSVVPGTFTWSVCPRRPRSARRAAVPAFRPGNDLPCAPHRRAHRLRARRSRNAGVPRPRHRSHPRLRTPRAALPGVPALAALVRSACSSTVQRQAGARRDVGAGPPAAERRKIVRADRHLRAADTPRASESVRRSRSKYSSRHESTRAAANRSRKPSGTVPKSSPTTTHSARTLSSATMPSISSKG